MLQNYEGTVLFWLLPSSHEQADLRAPIASLQKIINDTRVFFDPDQCIDDLVSITDLTIFLLLGPTGSDLLPILHSFQHLRHIYLSEPHEYAQHTSQVRGVFRTIQQLLPQLTKDVRMAQQKDSHLIVTEMGDLIQSHRSIADLQTSKADFQWKQTLIDIILDSPTRPTENIHQDLIDEWRLVYRSNVAQTRFIDEFEATYDPANAIYWYTRETFLYRMVNMALRTENIVIVWRLRFYIQDMYRQLQRLRAEQRKIRTSTGRLIQTLYRGQRMSTSELIELQKCVGGMIAMTSFVSTTKNPVGAEMFAGNGEEQPARQSVIFKIIIDESLQNYERSPFADISEFSSNPEEEEVLLCPGTVLQVKSVETKGLVTWVLIHMCQREQNKVPRQLIIGWMNQVGTDPLSLELRSLGELHAVLYFMRDFRQMQQILKVMQSLMNLLIDPLTAFWFEYMPLSIEYVELDRTDADYDHRCQTVIGKLRTLTRSVLDSQSFDDRQRDPDISLIVLIDDFLHMSKSDQDSVDSSKLFMELFERMTACCQNDIQPVWNLIQKRQVESPGRTEKLTDQSHEIRMHDVSVACRDKAFTEKDPKRVEWCFHLAYDAYKKGDYNQAIRLARDGLAIPSTTFYQEKLRRLLKVIYWEQKDWFASIECCQGIISMPQLPPNSPLIAEAYMDCGFACTQLEDYSEALLNYTKALELQEQHHPPRDPLTAKVHLKLGRLFCRVGDATTAMDHLQIAITLDFPEPASEAQKEMACIYKRMKQYDKARSHLLQCLDIRQVHLASKKKQLAETFLVLGEIEHITRHRQQRDLYFQQASHLVDSREDWRDQIDREMRDILRKPSFATD